MNLFTVTSRKGQVIAHERYKSLAKVKRDALNLEAGYNPDPKTDEGRAAIASGHQMPFIVTLGPDHWRNQR